MEKLELKHLAGYLPYGLKGNYLLSDVVNTHKDELRDKLLTLDNVKFFLDYATPILRPLSELTKEIEVNGEKFVPIEKIHQLYFDGITISRDNTTELLDIEMYTNDHAHTIDFYVGYEIVQNLLEWHFDIYGLIEKGLAIDINTLN